MWASSIDPEMALLVVSGVAVRRWLRHCLLTRAPVGGYALIRLPLLATASFQSHEAIEQQKLRFYEALLLTQRNMMLAKFLKRKESRQTIVESPTSIQEKAAAHAAADVHQVGLQQSRVQYRYQRPDLLGKVSSIFLCHCILCSTTT